MYSWYKAKYQAGVVGYCTKGHPHMTSPSFGGGIKNLGKVDDA